METPTPHLVFDLDSVVCKPLHYRSEEEIQKVSDKLGSSFAQAHTFEAYGFPHLIYPGFYALWQWVVEQGMKLTVFSSGIKERNEELVAKLVSRIFGKWENCPEIKVYSRRDCIDTTQMQREESKKYQSRWFGNLKKMLNGRVVDENSLPHTLLIEDDPSYVAKNEEPNLIRVASFFEYLPYEKSEDSLLAFHKAYYLAALIQEIRQEAQAGQVPVTQVAPYIQKEKYANNTRHRHQFYHDGLKILQKIDPGLKFYFDLNEEKRIT